MFESSLLKLSHTETHPPGHLPICTIKGPLSALFVISLFRLCQQAIHVHCDTPTKGAAPHLQQQKTPCMRVMAMQSPQPAPQLFSATPDTLRFPSRSPTTLVPVLLLSCLIVASPTSSRPRPIHGLRIAYDLALCGQSWHTVVSQRQSAFMSQHSVCAYARKVAGVQGSTVWTYGVHTGTTHVRRFVDARGPRLAFVCK
jgi:hypothetical protein